MLNNSTVSGGTVPGSLEEKLLANWTAGAANYSESVRRDLHSFKREAWLTLIRENTGTSGALDVLDVGTGPGFFAILLALEGHRVTAIDCTEKMLACARVNAEQEGAKAVFRLMDSHATDFPDGAFDLVISRNVTWTLFDADKAYAEWKRILKPGGSLVIFDANWNLRLFDEEVMREYERSMEDYRRRFGEEAPGYTDAELDYRRTMPMCRLVRPQWDFDALLRAGFSKIICDTDIGRRVYDEKELVRYRVSPMFMLKAILRV
ncbi:MAG: class I SAM-dependent methyltransferase [Treponema sp.]|jgi:SAM-dependent methyltransferase|nr:class I SAM-dependent methyltransferase [Treponema sp.]